jgi:hypothetical protein
MKKATSIATPMGQASPDSHPRRAFFVLFCFVLFCCPYGMYAYRRMSFGLCNAPASFQRCMMSIFSYMIEEIMEVFMDDFSVYGKTFNDCLNNLDKVLQ